MVFLFMEGFMGLMLQSCYKKGGQLENLAVYYNRG